MLQIEIERKRVRNASFIQAHKLIFEPSQDYRNAWGQIDKLRMWSKLYQQEVKDKEIILVNQDNEIMKLPYTTRFSTEYTKSVKQKLKARVKDWRDSMFLTLTLSPRDCYSLKQAHDRLKAGVHKLLHAARMASGRSNSPFTNWSGDYVYVEEMQKNGSPHVHILLAGATWVNLEWVRDLWERKYALGKQIKAKKVYSRWSLANYLTKYIAKQDGDTKILGWALNSHAYVASWARAILDNGIEQLAQIAVSKLQQIADKLTKKIWYYAGSFPVGVIATYSDLMQFITGPGGGG